VGDPVVGAGGLIGQVVFAAHSTATVRLITDGQSKVGVVYGNDETATLDGVASGKPLRADFIASTTPVKVGTAMTTDDLAGAVFPAGIPVAKVASVRLVPGASAQDVTATPVADLTHLAFVAVIQWGPGS
jgi:rod shape-determining protein MreC